MTVVKCLLSLFLFACGCSDLLEYPIDKLKGNSSLLIFTEPPFNVIKCYHDIDGARLFITVQSNLSLNDFTFKLLSEGWSVTYSSKRKRTMERIRFKIYEKMTICKQKGDIYQVEYHGSWTVPSAIDEGCATSMVKQSLMSRLQAKWVKDLGKTEKSFTGGESFQCTCAGAVAQATVGQHDDTLVPKEEKCAILFRVVVPF